VNKVHVNNLDNNLKWHLIAHTFPPFFLHCSFLFAAVFLSVCDVINVTVSLLSLSFGKSDLLALRVRRLGWILFCLLNNTLSGTVCKNQKIWRSNHHLAILRICSTAGDNFEVYYLLHMFWSLDGSRNNSRFIMCGQGRFCTSLHILKKDSHIMSD